MRKAKRQPYAIWQQTRRRIWQRDQGQCQSPYCQKTSSQPIPLKQAHIDHILELSRGGSNHDRNLRTLCHRCHVLRASFAHRGMIAAALRDGIIPADWRSLVWED